MPRPRTADYAMLSRSIDELEEHARAGARNGCFSSLERLVPEYRGRPSEPSAARLARLTTAPARGQDARGQERCGSRLRPFAASAAT